MEAVGQAVAEMAADIHLMRQCFRRPLFDGFLGEQNPAFGEGFFLVV
jgi:hypothetical protein